jgi:hypothetical protein
MAKSALQSEIRSRIDAFAAELTSMVRQAAFESLQSALGANGGAGPMTAAATTGGRRGRRKGAGRRGARAAGNVEAMASKVLTHLQSNDGQGVSEIARALGTSSDAVKPAITKLLEEKKLRKSGQRRGTRYHARGK